MSKIMIDTGKLSSVADTLSEIATEYEVIVSELYDTLINISNNEVFTSSNENGAANLFVKAVKEDRTKVDTVKDGISNYSEILKSCAANLDNIASTQV